MKNSKLITVMLVTLGTIDISNHVRASDARETDSQARRALQQLYSVNPAARHLRNSAQAVLVFPKIVKAGFVVGAQHGDGALISHDGRTVGYYRTDVASYDLQLEFKNSAMRCSL